MSEVAEIKERPSKIEPAAASRRHYRVTPSPHAEKRVIERIGMKPSLFCSLLSNGNAVQLNNPSSHWQGRAYFLYFHRESGQYFVAVVSPPANPAGVGVLVTVLDRAQHEADRGALPLHTLLQAAKRVIPAPEYDAFCRAMQPTSMPYRRRELRVWLWYYNENLESKRIILGPPNVPMLHLIRYGLENAYRHPDFWKPIFEKCSEVQVSSIDRFEIAIGDRHTIEVPHVGVEFVDNPEPWSKELDGIEPEEAADLEPCLVAGADSWKEVEA